MNSNACQELTLAFSSATPEGWQPLGCGSSSSSLGYGALSGMAQGGGCWPRVLPPVFPHRVIAGEPWKPTQVRALGCKEGELLGMALGCKEGVLLGMAPGLRPHREPARGCAIPEPCSVSPKGGGWKSKSPVNSVRMLKM